MKHTDKELKDQNYFIRKNPYLLSLANLNKLTTV